MPASTGPNLGIKSGWNFREGGWDADMNANLRRLDALVQGHVKNMVAALPGSPANGDAYILTTDKNLYVREGTSWINYGKKDGWSLYNSTDKIIYTYDVGTDAWINPEAKLNGTLLADDGLVGTPSISFANSTGTGFYKKAANKIGITAGGADIAEIDSTGITPLGTAATKVQGGTTAQRPGSPANGSLRYNSDLGALESYVGGSWIVIGGSSLLAFNSYSSNTTLTSANDVVKVSSAAAWSLTLPTTGILVGKIFRIINIDNAYTGNAVSIVGTLRRFGATSTNNTVVTPGEEWIVAWNGTDYDVIAHYTLSPWSATVASTLVMTTGVKGTILTDIVRWRRKYGNIAEIEHVYAQSTAGTNATDHIKLQLPNSLTMDTTLLQLNTSTDNQATAAPGVLLSSVGIRITATSMWVGHVVPVTSTTVKYSVNGTGPGSWGGTSAIANLGNANVALHAIFEAPISGWKD